MEDLVYTLAGVQAQLDLQQKILWQYQVILEEQKMINPRHRDSQEGQNERRRQETESLKNFKMMMDNKLSKKNILFNICDR